MFSSQQCNAFIGFLLRNEVNIETNGETASISIKKNTLKNFDNLIIILFPATHLFVAQGAFQDRENVKLCLCALLFYTFDIRLS